MNFDNVEFLINNGDIIIDSFNYSDWSNNIIFVTLADCTILGEEYQVTSGMYEAYFGGLEASNEEILVENIVVSDYKTLEVTFTDNIDISNVKISIEEKYSENVVEVINCEYLDTNKIQIKVDALKSATLYQMNIDNLFDLSNNKIDELIETFTGIDKNDDKQGINTIEVKNAYKIFVKYNVDYGNDALDKSNYKIVQNYGDKEELIINAVYQREEIIDDLNDDGDLDDISDNWITIELDNPTKEATLYSIEVNGITTKYGESLDSNEDSKTFTGKAVDIDGAIGIQVISKSYNEISIEVIDDSDVNKTFDISNVYIKEKYGDSELKVISLKEIIGSTIVLITESQKSATLYEITINEKLFDEFDNEIDGDITTTFTGKEKNKRIEDMSVLNESGGKSLLVEFDQKYGDDFDDINNYYIDGGIGYPSKIEKIITNDYTVRLIISETEMMKDYNISVKNVKNIDNEVMKDLTESFKGIGNK